MKINFLILIISISIFSCKDFENLQAENPVAKVFDKYLYPADIKHIYSDDINSSDSIIIFKNFIDNWIKEQLLLAKAEMNLTEEQKNVERQLDNYRTSLLIYKYEEQLIKQKLDTIISLVEIENYYNENSQNFILGNTLVKALYIKIPRNLPVGDIYNIRRWYRSNQENDLILLEDYCIKYAQKYDKFNNDWVYFSHLQSQFPKKINRPEYYLKYNKYIESQDSVYRYFIRTDDFRPKSEVAPLSFVQSRIRSILMNKRKITFIKELENNVYNEAMNRENIKIY